MCRDYNRLLGYSSEALLLSAGLQTAASFSLLSVFDQATTSDRFHQALPKGDGLALCV